MSDRSIVWLSSYPKSGSTWVRAFLTNYLYAGDTAADINSLVGVPDAASRFEFDELLGLASSDMTTDEISDYRPDVYRSWAARSSAPCVVKTHDRFGFTSRGEPMFPADASLGALYLVRNPLDVAVSFAHHQGLSLDETIDVMGDGAYVMDASGHRLYSHLPQTLGSWSEHVESWSGQQNFRTHFVRYEDMLCEPVNTFSGIVEFVFLELDRKRLSLAIELSSWQTLCAQERERGFVEKPPGMGPFFRHGACGVWRHSLSRRQVAKIVRHHHSVMARYGYLP